MVCWHRLSIFDDEILKIMTRVTVPLFARIMCIVEISLV